MLKEGVVSALGAQGVHCDMGAGYEYFRSHDVMCNCEAYGHICNHVAWVTCVAGRRLNPSLS